MDSWRESHYDRSNSSANALRWGKPVLGMAKELRGRWGVERGRGRERERD